MSRHRNQEGCELNMTPMIDVVFQLIIFFIVTITMATEKNEEIQLAGAPHGKPMEDENKKGDTAPSLMLILEVDRKGRVSINNAPLSYKDLQNVLRRRRSKFSNQQFPLMIRADYRTDHRFIRPVMDICANEGFGRISFVAIKDPKTPDSKKRFKRN